MAEKLESDLVRLAERVFWGKRNNPSPSRLKMTTRKILEILGRTFRKNRRRQKKEKQINFRSGWYLLAILVISSVALMLLVDIWWGIFCFSITLAYLATCLHEVRDPGIAYLRRMGRKIKVLPAGWYLVIPHFFDVDYRSLEKIVFDPGNLGMHLLRGTPIDVKVRVTYQLYDPDKAFEISEKEFQRKLEATVLARLRGEIGKRHFTEENSVLSEKGDIEDNILKSLEDEAGKDGYRVFDVEVYDLDEKIISGARSRAAYVDMVGNVEAEVRGKKVKAVSEGLKTLKDNWPGALALGLSGKAIIGDEEKAPNNVPGSSESKSTEEKKNEVPSGVAGIIEAAKKFLNLGDKEVT